jgi:hypothetical protein
MGKKLTITVETDDQDGFIVSSDWPLVHGEGPTFASALRDYVECVREWAGLVGDGARKGNKHDKADLRRIRKWQIISSEEGDMPSYWVKDVWKVLGAIIALPIAAIVYLIFRKR